MTDTRTRTVCFALFLILAAAKRQTASDEADYVVTSFVVGDCTANGTMKEKPIHVRASNTVSALMKALHPTVWTAQEWKEFQTEECALPDSAFCEHKKAAK